MPGAPLGELAREPAAYRWLRTVGWGFARVFSILALALAWELAGYDDIHASARLRRDLLRRVGPVVVEEALRCAA